MKEKASVGFSWVLSGLSAPLAPKLQEAETVIRAPDEIDEEEKNDRRNI